MNLKPAIFFLLTGFLVFGKFLNGQNLDSLKQVIKSANHDSDRVKALGALSELLPDGQWEAYNDQMIAISEKKANTLSANEPLGRFYLRFLAAGLSNLGLSLQQRGDNEKSLECHERALAIQKKIGDKKGVAATLNNIGIVYNGLGNTLKTLECYRTTLKIQEEIADKRGVAMTMNNLGYIYQSMGDVAAALDYHNSSMKLFEELDYKPGVGMALNNLSIISLNQGDTAQSIEYVLKSLRIREEIGDRKGAATCFNNLGFLLHNTGRSDEALDYYFKSLKISEELNNTSGIALSLGNIGTVYKSLADFKSSHSEYDKALYYYEKALMLREETGDKQGIALMLNNIAIVKAATGKLNEAKKMGERALQLSREIGFPESIKNSASCLRAVYLKQGDYNKALEMYELFVQMRDSVSNNENRKAAIKRQLQYDYEKKAAADSLKASSEKKVMYAGIKQKKQQRYFLYGGLVLTLFFGAFMFSRFRVTQKQKNTIEIQKSILTRQKDEVEEKQREVISSIQYARRIQKSLMPSEKYFERKLNENLNESE